MNASSIDKTRDTAALMQKIQLQGEPFLRATFEGVHEEILAQGFLIRRNIPNRRLLLQRYQKPGCPFCRDVATEFLIELPYRQMILSQNLGPYDRLSLLLRSKAHHTQAESIDFLERLGEKLMQELPDQTTLFCNQRAGNSQEHFHFQYLGRLLPVSQLSQKIDHLWSPSGFGQARYALFDGANIDHNPQGLALKHFWGCLISGSPEDATAAAAAYLRYAATLGVDRFNFSAWRDPLTQLSAYFLVLRRADTLLSKHPDFPMLIGALSVSGFLVDGRNEEQLKAIDYEELCSYLRNKIHPPAAFPE